MVGFCKSSHIIMHGDTNTHVIEIANKIVDVLK